MSVQFSARDEESLHSLAIDLDELLGKLGSGEALAVLAAFAAMERWLQPNDGSNHLLVWPAGEDGVRVSVTIGGRAKHETYLFSDFVDWDEHETNASGYGRALARLIETVNTDLTDFRLP